jgi:hypothetical protein
MSGLSRTPGKRVYGESRTAGSNPALSASCMHKSLTSHETIYSIPPAYHAAYHIYISAFGNDPLRRLLHRPPFHGAAALPYASCHPRDHTPRLWDVYGDALCPECYTLWRLNRDNSVEIVALD